MEYSFYKSNRKGKKYKVLTPSNESIHFGSRMYEDYTTHKDPKRKKSYIARHSAILKKDGTRAIDDIESPAFWSLNLLWNKPTLDKSIKDTEDRFGIKINKEI